MANSAIIVKIMPTWALLRKKSELVFGVDARDPDGRTTEVTVTTMAPDKLVKVVVKSDREGCPDVEDSEESNCEDVMVGGIESVEDREGAEELEYEDEDGDKVTLGREVIIEIVGRFGLVNAGGARETGKGENGGRAVKGMEGKVGGLKGLDSEDADGMAVAPAPSPLIISLRPVIMDPTPPTMLSFRPSSM